MTKKRIPYILAGLVTLIASLLVPIIIQELFAEKISAWKRLMIIAMPVLIGIMWYHVRKDDQNNIKQHSSDSVNKNNQPPPKEFI